MKQNFKLFRINDSTLQDCIKKGRGLLNAKWRMGNVEFKSATPFRCTRTIADFGLWIADF
jgi:hypothetical protein